jgi:glycosyltransferase domain-containing protein
LGNVAIIIPSKNRINYCLAQIRYYKKYNFSGILVIVDSSSKSNFIKLQNESNRLNFANLKLFHNSKLSAHEAIEFGLRQVEKKCQYFVFSGDDDFFVVNGIYRAAHFLDRNPDFIGVVGKGITTKHIGLDNSIKIGWVRTYWKPRDISNEDRLIRVKQVSRSYINLEFAVKRIASFIDLQIQLNKVFGKVEFNKSTDLEICSTLACALSGKIKYLRTKFLIRGDHDARPNLVSKPSFASPVGTRRKNFILFLDQVTSKYDKSLLKQSESIIDFYFNNTYKKKVKRSHLIVRIYYLFVRAWRKFNGTILKAIYKRYFKSIIDL